MSESQLSQQPQEPQPLPQPQSVKPWKVTAIGGMRLGAGITNVLVGLSLFWLIYPLLLIPLGIIEIISGANLLGAKPNKPSRMQTVAILEIVAIVAFNWVSMAVGILTLVWLPHAETQSYLASLPEKAPAETP